MFGIGWSELAVILCIAIIFIHPKDLPVLFRRLGRLYSKIKKVYAEIVATKDQFVKDIEEAAALEEQQETQKASATAGAAAGATSETTSTTAPEAAAAAESTTTTTPNAAPSTEQRESSPSIHSSSVE